MQRRKFLKAGGAVLGFSLGGGGCTAGPGPKDTRQRVDTPAKRRAFQQKMLKALCTDLGPRPSGSTSYDKGALLIRQELEAAGCDVELEWFDFERWEMAAPTELQIREKKLEVYPAIGSPSTPLAGLTGLVQPGREDKFLYRLVDPAKDRTLAFFTISPFGRAVPQYYKRQKFEGLAVANAGQPDLALLDEAASQRWPATLKLQGKLIPHSTTANAVGSLAGSTGEEILVIAHADTHFNTPGANDNAATVSVMLMLAHAFSGRNRQRKITFLATTGEEIGKLGAEHHAWLAEERGTLPRIKYCINLDSCTWGPFPQIHSHDQKFKDLVVSVHQKLGLPGPVQYPQAVELLDAESFSQAGAATLGLNSRGDDKTLVFWHRPEDVPENVNLDYAENGFRLVQGILQELAG